MGHSPLDLCTASPKGFQNVEKTISSHQPLFLGERDERLVYLGGGRRARLGFRYLSRRAPRDENGRYAVPLTNSLGRCPNHSGFGVVSGALRAIRGGGTYTQAG